MTYPDVYGDTYYDIYGGPAVTGVVTVSTEVITTPVLIDQFTQQYANVYAQPAPAPPNMTDYTYVFGPNGFILNADNNNVLPFVDVDEVDGIDSAPTRLNTTERTGIDGTWIDSKFSSMRTITVSGTLYADPQAPDAVCQRLRAEYSSLYGIQPFYFKHPGQGVQFLWAQATGVRYNIDALRRLGQTAIQCTMVCSDVNIYDWPASDVTLGAPTYVLNQNTDFSSGTSPWAATNSATIAQSSTFAFRGQWSLQINGNGTVALPGAQSEYVTVIPGGKYTASAEFYSTAAWASGAQVAITWYDVTQVLISTTTATAVALSASTWTLVSLGPSTAPANAAYAKVTVQLVGTPTAGQAFYVDAANITSTPGTGFNTGFNLGFGGQVTAPATSIPLTNNGTAFAYPTFVIKGPVVNPAITDTQSAITQRFSISLASSDTLLIDNRNKAIVLNNYVSMRTALAGINVWFNIDPDSIDTFYFSDDSGTGTYRAFVHSTYY